MYILHTVRVHTVLFTVEKGNVFLNLFFLPQNTFQHSIDAFLAMFGDFTVKDTKSLYIFLRFYVKSEYYVQ